MPTYSELKTIAQTLYGNSVGAGNFVESDSGSPSELAMLFHLIHGRIIGYPREWPFSKVVVTITATGASTYDLKTLYPDFLSLYQVFGINTNSEHEHYDNAEANITTIDGWTLRDGVLTFTGTIPASGSTFSIQYKSQYLVETAAGVRQKYFLTGTDVSVLSEADINVLVMGIGSYVNWKTDEVSQDKRRETKDWFQEAWTNMLLREDVSRPITSMI